MMALPKLPSFSKPGFKSVTCVINFAHRIPRSLPTNLRLAILTITAKFDHTFGLLLTSVVSPGPVQPRYHDLEQLVANSTANAQIPMINIYDDHDIIDGFGSYPSRFMLCP